MEPLDPAAQARRSANSGTEAPKSASSRRPAGRRTQQERSTETRERLLDATVQSLIDLGYAKTTTTVVCERAGLSRGAQVHHLL